MNTVKFNEPNIISICLCAICNRNVTYQSTIRALTVYLPHDTDTPSFRDKHKATLQRKGLVQLSCLQSSKAPSHFSFRHGFHTHSQVSLLQYGRQIRQHQTNYPTIRHPRFSLEQNSDPTVRCYIDQLLAALLTRK
jgi:hypothetical protein